MTICYQYACIFFMLAVDLKTEGETCYEEKHLRCVLTPPFLDLDRAHISLLQKLIPSHNAETFRNSLPDCVADKSMSIPQPTGLCTHAVYSFTVIFAYT